MNRTKSLSLFIVCLAILGLSSASQASSFGLQNNLEEDDSGFYVALGISRARGRLL